MNYLELHQKLDEEDWPSVLEVTGDDFKTLASLTSHSSFVYSDNFSFGFRVLNYKKGVYTVVRVKR